LPRLCLTAKILTGYFVMAIFFALASCYVLYSFRHIHIQLEQESLTSFEVLQSLHEIRVGLLSLDSRGWARASGESGDSLPSFAANAAEIETALQRLAAVSGGDPSLRVFSEEIRRYLEDRISERESRTVFATRDEGAYFTRVNSLLAFLDDLQSAQREELQARIGALDEAAGSAHDIVLFLTILGVGIGLVPAGLIARRIKGALGKLGSATQMIADGAFDYDPGVQSDDEIGELALGLKNMAQKLKNYEQLCLDASPLTRLPGNIAIERALLERIRRSEKFALCYADLDDFKAYNDTYGYAKGSEIIKVTGELLHNVKRRHCGENDFVGHIGGDDFVLITAPENASMICEDIIQEFDRVIPYFYSEEDRRRGYIRTTDRYGVTRQFPIMTISIAVVSDVSRDILSPTEVAQVAAEIKEYVKTLPGSNYLIDRRRSLRKSVSEGSDA